MCDRTTTSRAGSQVNFIEFVVAPIYAQVCVGAEVGGWVDVGDRSGGRKCRWRWRAGGVPPELRGGQRLCPSVLYCTAVSARPPARPPAWAGLYLPPQVYRIFPELGEALDNLLANRHFWQHALLAELQQDPQQAQQAQQAQQQQQQQQEQQQPGAPPSRSPEQRAEEVVSASRWGAFAAGCPTEESVIWHACHQQFHPLLRTPSPCLPTTARTSCTPSLPRATQAKAEKRLRDFQEKYRDILSKRRLQVGGWEGGRVGGCEGASSGRGGALRGKPICGPPREAHDALPGSSAADPS